VPDAVERLNTALEGRYRIERELGQGGMATVYLAEDIKHDRKVALKVLKPELAAVLGADRFVVEIKTTASLQHPHILPLFDSGTADGFLFYVMPYIEGETLRDKLDRETQFGIDEAVRITREVADALDYAHRHGIIHRDIKPENILLHDGRPMVADFGIALAVSAAAGGRMTETGTSVGTPHYMSPEQATADKEITGRADIYSLASVLYEMLTGSPPHVGSSAQQVIMKIIADTPRPVSDLRKSVPPNVAAAVMKALEKLPADRFGAASDFAGALQDPSFRTGSGDRAETSSSAGAPFLTRRALLVAGATFVLGYVGHGLVVRNPAGQATAARVSAPLDTAVTFAGPVSNAGRPVQTELALSPDGRTLVFSARGKDGMSRLFARPLEAASATPIEGTDGGHAPIFSPRGDQIAFFASGRLRRVPLTGGTPVDIATFRGSFHGASWADDGTIVFRDGGRTGLARVAEAGGAIEALPSAPDATLPCVLPGSQAVLYTVRYGSPHEERRVEVLRLGDATIDTIIDNASDARYVAGGQLLFARTGALMAVPFDAATLTVSGAPAGVVPDVMHATNGWTTTVWTDAAQYAVSAAGHLAWLGGGITPSERNEVVWLDRQGTATSLGLEPNWYLLARLDPTGDRLAVAGPGAAGGVWTVDLRRANAVRQIVYGFVPSILWTPDGQDIVYFQGGTFRIAADLSSASEAIDSLGFWPSAMTSDGSDLIFLDQSAGLGRINALTVSSGADRVLVEEPAGVSHPALSPDDRWLAYSTQDGSEVVVRSWPDLGRRTAVAGPDVSAPAWSSGGRELFYQQSRRSPATGESTLALAVQSFDPDAGRPIGNPVTIPLPPNYRSMAPVRSYDVTPDGRRIVAILRVTEVPPLPRRIEVWLNWASTVQRGRD